MRKPDDSKLTREQLKRIRKEAKKLLQKANAIGTFPTPVDEIMDVGKVKVARENILNEGFLDSLRRKAKSTLKKAISKVIGLFDARERLIFIDKSVLFVKQTFLKLHETGHAVLPWQNTLYTVIEDSKKELDPDTAELFEREANVFASEVLFQLDNFINEAKDMPFCINTAIQLSKKYGASIYASIRQYVSKNPRDCAVIVVNPPEIKQGDGFRANLRRIVPSPSFQRKFGDLNLPEYFTPDDELGTMIPLGTRRASRPRNICLVDKNGTKHECIAESFTNTYQVFILIHAVRTLTKSNIILSVNR